jgi:hypothetical protein
MSGEEADSLLQANRLTHHQHRKVRVINYQNKEKLRRKELRKTSLTAMRQSGRCTPNSKAIEELKAIVAQQNEKIEELSLLLDAKD